MSRFHHHATVSRTHVSVEASERLLLRKSVTMTVIAVTPYGNSVPLDELPVKNVIFRYRRLPIFARKSKNVTILAESDRLHCILLLERRSMSTIPYCEGMVRGCQCGIGGGRLGLSKHGMETGRLCHPGVGYW